MIDHPSRPRLAEIFVTDAGGTERRGTGYHVGAGWVLSAAHLVRGAASIEIWFGAPLEPQPEDGVRVDISQVVLAYGGEEGRPDLALLPVPGNPVEPVLFGHLDRGVLERVPAVAAGFPRFKLRPAAAPGSTRLREVHYATGAIVAGADAKKAQLAFTVGEVPGADPDPGHSPWEGMSGAAVWAGGRLIGVVGEHHPGDGLAGLTIEPLEALFLRAAEDSRSEWSKALPLLPEDADGLWLATPPTARQLSDRRAQRTAASLAPEILVAREGELALLAEFSRSSERWCWIRAGPFGGKTALLAWFVLHPPDNVDIVTCFLRRADATNTPVYALGVLNRQLAALASGTEYHPSDYVAERAEDFRDLLATADRASSDRGRRLLLVVDGLDEYEADPIGLDHWLPDAQSVPAGTSALVSSRTGARVDLAVQHPLHGAVRSIDASEAAAGIQERAKLEIESAAADRAGLAHPVIGFLEAADAGLAASELTDLLRLYGRATDASDVSRTLQTSLGRSVRESESRSSRKGPEPVHVFSHESLLTAAKSMFADARVQYVGLIDSWADGYEALAWPADVPRYLLTPYLRHLTTRSLALDEPAVASTARDRLSALCSDPRWLRRAIHVAGVDAGIDALAGAQRAVPDDWLDAITRSLRRSRVALAMDPDQLATQLHGRLGTEPDPQLRGYVSRLPSVAPRPWVKLRGAALGWRADLETMFTYGGKVRAVAFGQAGSRVVLAVGAGDLLVIRDVQRGADAEWVLDGHGLRVTAVAMGTVDGRFVAVAVAGYDGKIAVRDVRTGQPVGATIAGSPDSVAIGTLRGRPTVAGVAGGRLLLWDVETGKPIEVAAMAIADRSVVGVGTVGERVVAHVTEEGDCDSSRLLTIDLERGSEAAPPVALSRRPDLVASWAYADGIAVITRAGEWRVAEHATAAGPLRPVRSIQTDERVRAVAIARVAGRYVATTAPDNDLEIGFVAITELTASSEERPEPAEPAGTAPDMPRDIEAVVITAEDAVQLLTADPVTLVDADTGAVSDPNPTPGLVATALTGQSTGDLTEVKSDGALQFKEAPPAATNARRPPRDRYQLNLRADQPDTWPTLTRAFGVVRGDAVIARGSYSGAVWVQDLASGRTVAGPFVVLPPISTIFLNVKPSPDTVSSVAVGEYGGVALAAAAFDLRAWVALLGDTPTAPTVIKASSVVAVALGRIADQNVVVTGSRGGFVGIWRADTGERVTGLTLDSGVERVWVVHGADAIAARTADHVLVIAEVAH